MLILFLDEKRRKKAMQTLFVSSPVRSASMPLNLKPSEASVTTEETEISSAESKEEEVVKLKPSQLPLMNQVCSHLLIFIKLIA